MVIVDRFRAFAALTVILTLIMSPASAAVRAQVDRPVVDMNESFMLEVIIDRNTDLEPDLSVLEADFHVGQASHLSNTSIFNGEIRRSRTWTIALMPKRAGVIEIPPITIGAEQSAPLTIQVNEPADEPPGEADVFITSEVDRPETYVQAQILYRIKIYRAVPTRQPALREPGITGAEVLVELVGDEKSYEAVLGGKTYSVVERVIAIYPQESGEVEISPARFEARVLRAGRITGRKMFESEAHTVRILPIPAPPTDHPDAVWLPARDVVLSEEWSREPDRIDVGEPVTRRVTVTALGQIETQIPAIEPPQVDGLNIYADKPELSRRVETAGIRGIRKDQYAMIGVAGGDIELPAQAVPWWDIEAGEWRVATLPARTITVRGAAAPPPAESLPQQTPVVDAEPEAPPPLVPDGFWPRAAQLLLGLWLVTVFAWWWSARDRKREPRAPAPPPIHKQQARQLKAARKAALAGDGGAVRAALLEWGRLQWPDAAPRSIGELAQRVSAPLADELRDLSSASYGPTGRAWDGAALARALRSFAVLRDDEADASPGPLPPLMPPAA